MINNEGDKPRSPYKFGGFDAVVSVRPHELAL